MSLEVSMWLFRIGLGIIVVAFLWVIFTALIFFGIKIQERIDRRKREES